MNGKIYKRIEEMYKKIPHFIEVFSIKKLRKLIM